MDDATGTSSCLAATSEATASLVNSLSTLAKFLADEALVEDKIQASQVALAAVKKKISESLVQSYLTRGANIKLPEDLMSQEQYYERLLLALQEMKRDLTQRIRPLELDIIEANRAYLREIIDLNIRQLTRCLEKIDETTLACRRHLEQYNSIRSELHSLNDRLVQLGAAPLELPRGPTGGDLGEMILSRLEHLKSIGRI
jgi:hypothetical protein